MSKTSELTNILYNELVSPEGLSFPDLMGSVNKENSHYIEDKLLSIADFKQKEFDKIIELLGYEKNILKLNNALKLGIITVEFSYLYKTFKAL